jgi:hypothetical protein
VALTPVSPSALAVRVSKPSRPAPPSSNICWRALPILKASNSDLKIDDFFLKKKRKKRKVQNDIIFFKKKRVEYDINFFQKEKNTMINFFKKKND